ncbi:FlgB family protein [Palleronia sp. LCG004]|uniref:FlgB family protein n=1 Tax=Palleronia sp. LCG004 TaxID=3079304 RepID=UPI002942CF70|nr:FlgB family protein [Palleronia sp. LCG004]WOI56195.1 FlgB family protein [Palleronia sp. LCG004]
MIQTGLMKMVHDAASHAANRQTLIARNIANADTPGYRASDLASFAESLDALGIELRTTRAGHLPASGGAASDRFAVIERTTEGSPNGNNVSLENEMMQSTEAEQQHQTALSIYSSARDILRTSLGRTG